MDSQYTRPSSYQYLEQLGPDWQPGKKPSSCVQIVPVNPPITYDALLHDSPNVFSGYFNYNTAYNNNQISKCGYKFYYRRCDGNQLSSSDIRPTPTPSNRY